MSKLPPPVDIALTSTEMMVSTLIGSRRNLESIQSGREPRFSEKYAGEMYARHICGAQAECAVAKHLNVYWSMSINHFKCGDVDGHEVRWSPYPKAKIRERDDGLVIACGGGGNTNIIRLHGFIDAGLARTLTGPSRPRPDGPDAWFISLDHLMPMHAFPKDR